MSEYEQGPRPETQPSHSEHVEKVSDDELVVYFGRKTARIIRVREDYEREPGEYVTVEDLVPVGDVSIWQVQAFDSASDLRQDTKIVVGASEQAGLDEALEQARHMLGADLPAEERYLQDQLNFVDDQDEEAIVSDTAARIIASQRHGGEDSALYAFATTGVVDGMRIRAEIMTQYVDGATRYEDKSILEALVRHLMAAEGVDAAGNRPPVDGWVERTTLREGE
jgi:hypothetical protein